MKKIDTITIKPKYVITIILLSIAFLYRINAVKVSPNIQSIIFAVYALVAILYYYKSKNTNMKAIGFTIVKFGSVPYIAAFLYTIFLSAFIDIPFRNITRAFSISLNMVIIMLVASSLIFLFRSEAIKVLFYAMILSYAITILMAVFNLGMTGLFEYLANPLNSDKSIWFEMHDLVISLGFFILYYLFYPPRGSKHKKMYIFSAAVVLYFGFKRIVFLGLLLTIPLGLFIGRKGKIKQNWKIGFIAFTELIACIVYTWLVSSENFVDILSTYNINSMGRINFYAYFKQFYEFDVFYMGRGLGFVTKQLEAIIFSHISGVSGVLGLHNDLLKIYIELGFVGFSSWIIYYLYWVPKQIQKKYSFETLRLFYLFISFAFITYLTDNTSTYPIFQLTFYTIIGTTLLDSNAVKCGIMSNKKKYLYNLGR